MAFKTKKPEASGTTASPVEGPKSPRGYADGKRYDAALGEVRALKEKFAAIEAGLEASAKEVVSIEEDRRREGATFAFNLEQSRKEQLAAFAEEDKVREEAYQKKVNELGEGVASLQELLGLDDGKIDRKALVAAFNAKMEAAHEAGAAEAKRELEGAYQTKKTIDAANAKTELSLLQQKNGQLETRVTDLAKQVEALLATQAKTNDTVADVARKGLEAAAGVVAQGNMALNTAAGAPIGGSRVR